MNRTVKCDDFEFMCCVRDLTFHISGEDAESLQAKGSQWMSTFFNNNDVLASGVSTNWLFNFWHNPPPTPTPALISLPGLPGFWSSQPKRSERHYFHVSYLQIGSIDLWILPWLDSRVHQPPIFPLVNPKEHLSAGTRWCIVWRPGECSLSCFSMRRRDQ